MKNRSYFALFYFIKFMIYGGISAYDYSIHSKWTLGWLIIAFLCLAFAIIEEIEHHIDEVLKSSTTDINSAK